MRKDLIVVESFRRFNQVVSHNWPHVLVQSHLVGGSHIQPYLRHSGTTFPTGFHLVWILQLLVTSHLQNWLKGKFTGNAVIYSIRNMIANMISCKFSHQPSEAMSAMWLPASRKSFFGLKRNMTSAVPNMAEMKMYANPSMDFTERLDAHREMFMVDPMKNQGFTGYSMKHHLTKRVWISHESQ